MGRSDVFRSTVRPRCTAVAAGVLAVVTVVGGACSNGSGTDDGPGQLVRIDGPAQVDPDVVVGGSSGTDG